MVVDLAAESPLRLFFAVVAGFSAGLYFEAPVVRRALCEETATLVWWRPECSRPFDLKIRFGRLHNPKGCLSDHSAQDHCPETTSKHVEHFAKKEKKTLFA